jgi:hypothetical protein
MSLESRFGYACRDMDLVTITREDVFPPQLPHLILWADSGEQTKHVVRKHLRVQRLAGREQMHHLVGGQNRGLPSPNIASHQLWPNRDIDKPLPFFAVIKTSVEDSQNSVPCLMVSGMNCRLHCLLNVRALKVTHQFFMQGPKAGQVLANSTPMLFRCWLTISSPADSPGSPFLISVPKSLGSVPSVPSLNVLDDRLQQSWRGFISKRTLQAVQCLPGDASLKAAEQVDVGSLILDPGFLRQSKALGLGFGGEAVALGFATLGLLRRDANPPAFG